MARSLLLQGIHQLHYQLGDPGPPPPGSRRLEVLYCAICRTDAKMWDRGHRDLHLPRIPGHEIAARDPDSGRLYTVWPGVACGHCRYCGDGRDNLCDEMRIIGFHHDGGFADWLDVPTASMVPVNLDIPPHLLCFTEPLACCLTALTAVAATQGESVLIFGGGVVGLLAALASCHLGCRPIVIEPSSDKRSRISSFCRAADIALSEEGATRSADIALTACDAPEAFSQALNALVKGGRLAFFSGLSQQGRIDNQTLNLLHYRAISLQGCYGPTYSAMVQALPLLLKYQTFLPKLIEDMLLPNEAAGVMADILTGRPLKYLIDFTSKKEK